MSLRVIIADDHPLIRIGVEAVLARASGLELAGQADSTTALIDKLATTPCDVLVTDLSMPGETADGLSLIGRIKRTHPQLPIIVLTMMTNPSILAALLKAGAEGLVDKSSDLNDVVVAINAIRHGKRFVSASFLGRLEEIRLESGARLSAREAEVIRLVVAGMSVSAIAAHFSKSVKTVSRQKKDAMRKLGVANDAELFVYAKEHGLL